MKGDRQDQMDDIVTSQGHRVQPPATCTQCPCILREGQELERGRELEKGPGHVLPCLPGCLTPGRGTRWAPHRSIEAGCGAGRGSPQSLPREPAGALLSLAGQLGVRPQAPILSSDPIRVQASIFTVLHSHPSSAKHPTTMPSSLGTVKRPRVQNVCRDAAEGGGAGAEWSREG